MPTKKYKPTSPGRRFMSVSTFEEITKGKKPEKSLMVALPTNAGRNNQGKITVRHQGGGHKKQYRIVDFKRNKLGIPGKVAAIEYDPNRTSRIALINYADGEKRYILAPLALKVGDTVQNGPEAEIKPGNALPIRNIPVGTTIHNIEIKIGRGGQLVRSAGGAGAAAGQGGRLRPGPDAVRRGPAGAGGLLRHHRAAGQRRPRQRDRRQGRQEPLARQAPVGSRHDDEPVRPPPRWW